MPNPVNPSTIVTASGRAIRLVELLRQLPQRELDSLIGRLRIHIDPLKRLDVPAQVARALLNLPEVRDPSQLPGPTRELLHRIAESRGVLAVDELPAAVEPLVALGMVYVRGRDDGRLELLFPIAFMVQMRSWEGEDPRGVRALLSQSNHEVAASIASHYLGRPATMPVALALEPAWEVLTDPEWLQHELSQLAQLERKLLHSIEEVGGEVDTEELLDLEREPLRLRGATGATPSRRGVGFALERRGFLIPIHPNRHVVPNEIGAIIGAERRAQREARRTEIRGLVLGDDHAPRRARFAEDPAPLVVAMAMAVRDPSAEVKPGVGTPRSLIAKFASRFGRDQDTIALLAALSRAAGIWDPSVVSVAAPPGSLRLHQLAKALFDTWRRGGAWDEARSDGEILRAAGEAREASAVGVIRDIVLEALAELSDGCWSPWQAVEAYVRADSRAPGVARLIERWAQRSGVDAPSPTEIARRIALGSLRVLGVVDLGDADDDDPSTTKLRITPRGRSFIRGEPAAAAQEVSRFIDNQVLRIGGSARLGHVAAISPFVETGCVAGNLDVVISQQSIALALSAGYEASVVAERLAQLAPVPDPVSRTLAQASTVLGRAELVETGGFLWVDDPELREMLRTRRQTAELFVDPSPPSGLLVAAGVDVDRLARRLRALGVELVSGGKLYRTRSTAPPGRRSGSHRLGSASLAAPDQRSGAPRRRSSQSIPATKRGSGG
ncbi:MAG: hypothetical protein JW940_23750 [Polyangiaceae bacterium]|nr:hypothetical protein [Polyangiaceae bacterium]